MTELDCPPKSIDSFSRNVLETFKNATLESFKQHPWNFQFRQYAVEICRPHSPASIDRVEAFCGQGRWGEIAWIGFAKNDLAPSWNTGLYVALFYAVGGKSVVLSLQQGVEELVQALGTSSARNELLRRRSIIQQVLPTLIGFSTDDIKLNANYIPRGKMYESAHIIGKSYAGSFSSLESDLRRILDYYADLQVSSLIVDTSRNLSYVDQLPEALEDDLTANASFKHLIDRLSRAAVSGNGLIDCGSLFSTGIAKRRIGQQVLRSALLKVYKTACAACGNDFVVKRSKKKTHIVQAAHVLAVSRGGAMLVRNGILLCPDHHWAFDNFLWTITEDRCVQVHRNHLTHAFLKDIDGKPLAQPHFPQFELSDDAILHHRKRYTEANS